MEHAEVVLSAIKNYEGGNEGVRYEVLGVEMWEDLPSGLDAEEYDGDVSWGYNGEERDEYGYRKQVEYEVYACVIAKGEGWERATLLRSVGREQKDGTAYGGLDAWLPKNAFGKDIWSEEEKIKLLQKRFADINDDYLRFYHVRVIEE